MIPRAFAKRSVLLSSTRRYSSRSITALSRPPFSQLRPAQSRFRQISQQIPQRNYATKSSADEKIEELTELFATAQDEFEIAMEETEKVSVYAEEDRGAAREELEKLKEAYNAVIDGPDKDLAREVKTRIGQRVRELEAGVKRMEEMALEQD